MQQTKLGGIITPLLTPFRADGSIDDGLFQAHAAYCLAEGSHMLSPFGTTGEAASISIAARRTALEALVLSGKVRPEQLIPGTGLTSLADTIEQSRHAVELGAAAVLLLPPFYFNDVSDEGLYAYFAALIEGVADPRLRIILYHIPHFTGVGISPALTRRLALDFPGIIAGYKDSSGEWTNTVQILRAAPKIAVLPGSETFLGQAMATGGAGCISASCNINARAIRAVYDDVSNRNSVVAKEGLLRLEHVRQALAEFGLIRSLKAVMAMRSGQDDWRRCLPPLRDAPRQSDVSEKLRAIALPQSEAMSS